MAPLMTIGTDCLLLTFAVFCCLLLCFAMFCYVLLCFAMFRYFCYVLLSSVMFCYAVLYSVIVLSLPYVNVLRLYSIVLTHLTLAIVFGFSLSEFC
jgi:hypothetical protein